VVKKNIKTRALVRYTNFFLVPISAPIVVVALL
jgi:hypothetical protein